MFTLGVTSSKLIQLESHTKQPMWKALENVQITVTELIPKIKHLNFEDHLTYLDLPSLSTELEETRLDFIIS